MGRGVKAPRWYRSMTHVNLPDAHGIRDPGCRRKSGEHSEPRACPVVSRNTLLHFNKAKVIVQKSD